MPSRIDILRAQVRARQQAANRKVRRIERMGIEITGSKYDPRKPGVDISKMRTRDLLNYQRQLDSFVSRGTQFVGLSGGKPLPRTTWRKYKALENKRNRRAQQLEDTISNVKMPGGQMTLGERHAAVTDTKFPKTANHTVNSPLRRHKVVPGSVTSEKALKALTKQQQKMVDPKFLKMFVNRGRKEAYAMLAKSGHSSEISELKKLTDKQFHILWAYTEYATLKSIIYEQEKMEVSGRAKEEIDRASAAGSREWIDWAKTIDDEPTKNPNAIKLHTSTKAGPINIWTNTKAGPIDL